MTVSETDSTTLYAEDNRFTTRDRIAIYYRYWHGSPGLEGETVLILHDHQEHSAYYAQLAGALAGAGYRVFAWDARDYGRSVGSAGERPAFHQLVQDLDDFTGHLRRHHQVDPAGTVAIGQGLGAAVLCTWLHDYAPTLGGAVLGSPPFHIPASGLLRRQLLEWTARWRPDAEIRPYRRLHDTTHDRNELALRRDDPFIRDHLPVRLVLSQQQAMQRVLYRPESIELPVLMLTGGGGRDEEASSRRFFERLGSVEKTWQRFERSAQAIFHDGEREAATALVMEFLRQALDNRRDRAQVFVGNVFRRERPGRSAEVSPTERLGRLHRLSRGARLARDTGLHSGHHTDYLLRNRAQGRSALSRRVDRWYLDQGRCAALRERYRLLRELIEAGLAGRADAGRPLRILQLGGAPARCLIEHFTHHERQALEAVCVDTDRTSLEAGRRNAGLLGLRTLRFVHGEIRDPALVADWPWPLDLIVADGALERCRDHAEVLRLLRVLNGALRPQGRLIVGNMLPHPLAACDAHDDQHAWTHRDPAELNRLLRLVGLEPQRIEVEPRGIYSLVLAVRRGQRGPARPRGQ